MKAILDLNGQKIEIDNLRIFDAEVGTSKNPKKVWRWSVTSNLNGFKIVKYSGIEMHSKEQAMKNAEKNGITII